MKQIRFDGGTQTHQYFATTPDTAVHDANDPDKDIPNVTYAHERPYDRTQAGNEFTPALAGGMLSLSAQSDSSGKGISQTGILWAATPISIGTGQDRERLTAYNAQDVTQKVFDSGDTLGPLAKFVPPTISNGRVYLPTFYAPAPAGQTDHTNANRLHVFGLLNSAVTMTAIGFPAAVVPGQQRTITVTLQDKNSATAVSYQGTVQLTSSEPAAILPPAHTFTDGDAGTFTFTLNTPGTQTITALDQSAGGYTATQTNIRVFGVTGVNAASGPTGSTPLTITGSGFTTGVTVTFGGAHVTVTDIAASGMTLAVMTPAHITGTVDIVITLGGASVTLPQAYTFVLPTPSPPHTVATMSPTPAFIVPQPAPSHLAVPTVSPIIGMLLPQPVRH